MAARPYGANTLHQWMDGTGKPVCCSINHKATAGSGKSMTSHIDSCNKLVQGHQSIGSASYERSFGLNFIHEKDLLADNDYGPEMRILPCRSKFGLRSGLAGKRVALVGNGEIRDCGPLIDAHDEVIRITTMRAWQADPVHDGTRTTIWAGHPWIVVRRNPAGVPTPKPKFEQLLKEESTYGPPPLSHFSRRIPMAENGGLL
ncbi:hypothetical protein HED49_17995 [Ochrobactrum daejeonense]|nr:hypothetical protein [Brucella daejeonensis]